MAQNIVTGVDIGGSHITVGLIDLDKKILLQDTCVRHKVDCHAPADNILLQWTNAIEETWRQFGQRVPPIGFAMPGPFDYELGISYIKGFDKYDSLYGLEVGKLLADQLQLQVDQLYFRNDAEAFLEGEVFCGAAQGFSNAIGITLGTGLGSAICRNGKSWDAELSILPYQGTAIEEAVSTRGLLRNYFQLTGRLLKDAKSVAGLYDSDSNAVLAFDRFSKDLAWFLVEFIEQNQPEVVVIGGNIVQAWHLFMEKTQKELVQKLGTIPKIVRASLGENAALIGAAIRHIAPILS